MNGVKRFTSRILAVMLSGALIVGNLSVSAFGAEDAIDFSSTTEIATEEEEKATEETSVIDSVGTGDITVEESTNTSTSAKTARENSVIIPVDAAEAPMVCYTVTLDANGGYFENEWDDVLADYVEKTDVLNKIISVGESVNVMPVNERGNSAATFLGWSLERDGEIVWQKQEDVLEQGQIGYIPVSNCLIYAVWEYDDTTNDNNAHEGVLDSDLSREGSINEVTSETAMTDISKSDISNDVATDIADNDVFEESLEGGEINQSSSLEESSEISSEDFLNDNDSKRTAIANSQDENNEVGDEIARDEETDYTYVHGKNGKWADVEISQGKTMQEDIALDLAEENDDQETVSTNAMVSTVASGICGSNLTWILESDGTLTISGKGEMVDGVIYWGTYENDIRKVIINEGVESVGQSQFSNCVNLEEVNLPISICRIGSYAFEGCEKLSYINLPLKLETIGDYAFRFCYELKNEITIPSTVVHIGEGAFEDCYKLTNVQLPDNLDIIKNDTFAHCKYLKDVSLPTNVKSIGKMAFYGCTNLNTIIVPSGAESIGYASFSKCSNLSKIIIPESIVSIGKGHSGIDTPFDSCAKDFAIYAYSGSFAEKYAKSHNIRFVDISGIDEEKTINYGYCGNNLLWKVITDAELYKKYAPSSWKIYPTNLDDRKILVITGNGDMYDYENESSVPWNNMDIEIMIIENGVTSIGDHAFDGMHFINEIELPETITHIGDYSFAVDTSILGNSSLRKRKIIIPSQIKSIGNHFIENCSYDSEVMFTRGTSPESFSDDCFAGAQATVYFPYNESPWIDLYVHPDLYQYGSSTTSSIHWYPWSGNFSTPEKEGRKSGVLGELLAVDANDRSIKVDGTKYYVSTDVDLGTLAKLHSDYLNSNDEMLVICKKNFDFVEDVELVSNVIEEKITVSCSNTSLAEGKSSYAFVYSDGKYTANDVSLNITVHYGLKDNDYYSEKDFPNLVNKPLELNNLEMVFESGNNNLIKEFSNNTSGKISIANNLSIPYGESKTVQVSLHPQSVPASINDQLTVTVSGEKASGGSIKGSGSIRFYNEDLQEQQTSARIQNTPKEVNSSAAKTALKSCSTVRTSNFPNLMGILNSSQQEAVQSCVNLWIAEMIIAKKCDTDKDYFNSIINGALKGKAASKGISLSELLKVDGWAGKVQDKLLSKVLGKMGLSEDCFLFPGKKTGGMTIVVASKYGPCILKFDLDLDLYGFGKKADPFAAYGTLTCTINGLTEEQIGTYRSVESPVTFTNTRALCNAMKNLLMSSIETVYSEAYGKDVDKAAGMIADMIVTYPVSALLSEYGVSLSGSTYGIAIQAAENSYKGSRFSKTTVRCPVDIYVYDSIGNLCGAIVNNTVDPSYNELGIYVDGDEKTVYLTGDDYRIKYVGNDVGSMDVDITYYLEGQSEDRILRFEDIPIEKDQAYESYVPESSAFDSGIYAIRKGGEDSAVDNVSDILPIYDSLQEEKPAIGVVVDRANATCNIGSTIQLEADTVPLNAKNVSLKWATDNEDVATVTQTGIVMGVGFGTANIIVSSNTGSFTTTCRVVVGKLDSEDESLIDAGIFENDITWKLNDKGTLTVSGKGDLPGDSFGDSGSDGDPVYARRNEIKKVIIEDGITGIGDSDFANCKKLTEIILPESVVKIEIQAFRKCVALKKIDIPDGVKVIGDFAFENCTNLSEVTIGKGLTNVEAAVFFNCTSLEKVVFKGSAPAFRHNSFLLVNTTAYYPAVDTSWTDEVRQSYRGNISWVAIKASISNCEISVSDGECVYTGAEIWPTISIKDRSVPLSMDTDYTVSCHNNINVGTATLTVTGIGNYEGTVSKNYNIKPVQISKAAVTGLSAKTYSGKAIIQVPTVELGSNTLTQNTDYTVLFSGNTNVGIATVTIIGKGNYTGSKKATFRINKANQAITVKNTASSIAVGKTATISLKGAKSTTSYKSSNTGIATVNSKGVVTAKKVGTVKITATSSATSNYNAAFKTVSIKVVPKATSSITATNQATGIKLTWKKVTGATGYKVYRGSTLIKTIKSGSTVTCTDTKANTNGTKYIFNIIPIASTGNGIAKNATAYRVAKPAVKTVKNSSPRKMTVTWEKNSKATGYQIQYSMSKTFASGNKTATVTKAATVSKVIGSLTKGKTYYVRIRANKTVGKTIVNDIDNFTLN